MPGLAHNIKPVTPITWLVVTGDGPMAYGSRFLIFLSLSKIHIKWARVGPTVH